MKTASINILSVTRVQGLNRGVLPWDPAHFSIIYAAPADFLIRVWVPRKYAGQPYTRPRVNGLLSLKKESPDRFPRRILLSGTRVTTGENGPSSDTSSPSGGVYQKGVREKGHDDRQRQDHGKKIRHGDAPGTGRYSQRRPCHAAPYAGRGVVQGSHDKRELAHDHDRPAPP